MRQPMEAGIVDTLRASCDDIFSLVSVEDEEIVGYILFSLVVIERHTESRTARLSAHTRRNYVQSSVSR